MRHIEGKCMPYTMVLCSVGKLQIEYISTCNRSLLCFPISPFLWVTGRQQWLHGFALLQGHLECRPVVGPENRCCNQLWAVRCWHILPFRSLRLTICVGKLPYSPCRAVVNLQDSGHIKHKASTMGPQCSICSWFLTIVGPFFFYQLFYKFIS